MTRAHILSEIKRTAKGNDGQPLGRTKFKSETGIRESDWLKYWARWSDALLEAGLSPNQFNSAYNRDKLLTTYARLAQRLGRLPSNNDLRLQANTDKTFPGHTTWTNRFGAKPELVKHVRAFCKSHNEYVDVVKLCEAYSTRPSTQAAIVDADGVMEAFEIGVVYLVKSGRYYKIGRSNSAGRRTYELDLQLPERTKTIHVIRTDDPAGIERYWHSRFASQRKNGEWFELGASEVAAFRRRKTM